MEQIYEMKLWGGAEFDFYFGKGSHEAQIVNLYIAVVTSFDFRRSREKYRCQ